MSAEQAQDTLPKGTKLVLIEDELKNSFLDYAMSVVVSRAIPDVRDGLKPVHRRVLYAMHELGYHHNKPYRKSVRVVGDVLGKYHPHGDQAVYNTMVGMVQDFAKRYPLLDGQGNWGSVDGDNAAAMRYTEVRMQKITQEILADIEKNTVPFVPNFDESTIEPTILPSRLPNLLINGTAGIAVGMATSIPPHNLGEVIDGCLAFLANEALTDDELIKLIPAPDFPTGGIICGRSGVLTAYKTGRGKVVVRGVTDIQETKKGFAIIITELPYQVNKAELIIKIADLVKNKIVEGISNIRDESDRRGMRVVIEVRKNEIPDVILNQLYKYTPLQTSISILSLALLDNRPLIFTLRELVKQFLLHRETVVYKRTVFDLEKAQAREHILLGFIIALDNIDPVVQLIKKSKTAEDAMIALEKEYKLSVEQSKAILEMRLQRLTGLEQEKIHSEIAEIKKKIEYLNSVINNRDILKKEIKDELVFIKENYANPRRTKIEDTFESLTDTDLIPDEDVVITLTQKGYIKRVSLDTYGVQHRGGKGKMGMQKLEDNDDIVRDMFVTKNLDELLFFTSLGRVYSMPVYEVAEGSRTSKGRAVINLLPLVAGESVVKLLCMRGMENKQIVMVTKKGVIKKTDAKAFAKIRVSGIRALGLNDDDALAFCGVSSGDDNIVIATAFGQGIRFKESEVRTMGRQAAGVRGIKLKEKDRVVGMEIIADEDKNLLFATAQGYGKRTRVGDFRVAHRGGLGVRTIPTDRRNGEVVGLVIVGGNSHILLIDDSGKIIHLLPSEIRTMGRQAKGVRLIRLDKDRTLASIVAFEQDEEDEVNGSSGTGSSNATVKADNVQIGGKIVSGVLKADGAVSSEDGVDVEFSTTSETENEVHHEPEVSFQSATPVVDQEPSEHVVSLQPVQETPDAMSIELSSTGVTQKSEDVQQVAPHSNQGVRFEEPPLSAFVELIEEESPWILGDESSHDSDTMMF
ncbi:DNA gyrase subunit A [Candidatus Babeliales bacterium]|nr:DNA gyrase subunit A [Candidatus Babeliales bacterium]